jgi:hypothetical protein
LLQDRYSWRPETGLLQSGGRAIRPAFKELLTAKIIATQSLTVPGTANTYNTASTAAPEHTEKVLVSSPVACRVELFTGNSVFESECYAILDGQPTAGDAFFVSRPFPTITTFTFVASGATGNQINIGANLAATMTNLVNKLNAMGWTGVTTTNLNASVAGMFHMLRTSGSGSGPDGDAWSIGQGAGGPLSVPASNESRYFQNGGGVYVPANQPVELPAAEGDKLAVLSAGTGSDVSAGAGLTMAWIGTPV